MFPIPGSRCLSLLEIADYWSREARPPVTRTETLIELIQAWWRGEFTQRNGPSRLQMLKAICNTQATQIEFLTPDSKTPNSRLDGEVVVIRPSVRLPSRDEDSWSDTNCAWAYEDLAREWPWIDDHAVGPLIAGTELDRDEFFHWLSKRGPWRPTFWGQVGPTDDDPQGQTDALLKGKRTKREEIASFVARKYPDGIPAAVSLKEIARNLKVNERTVRRALGRK
jgi:hypothetical protein